MASSMTLRVTTPAGKKPIRKLPSNIEIGAGTTVEEAKKIIARHTGMRDYHRIAIVDTTTKSIIKDRLSILAQNPGVQATGDIAVKDLGPQVSWRTVYVVEYAGPIFLSLLLAYPLRAYIYPSALFGPPTPFSTIQTISLALIVLHFIKRELETVFLHRFSAATMPTSYIFRNLAYYWLSMLNIAYWVFAPNAAAASPLKEGRDTYIVAAGLAVYLFGELANFNTHVILANLRPKGTTKRGIPQGFGFGIVACPNYLFELVSWIGVLLVTRSFATGGFCVVAWLWMQRWAVGREKRYRKEFGKAYKPHLYPMTPGWALPIRKAKE
ncbi:hypothetical protein VE02_00102 [Pseudogymnoascus sp. 03VT05]|nr:hypothetical protein VE02_00102 [Pseudogymnoascus sp. 03VT05]